MALPIEIGALGFTIIHMDIGVGTGGGWGGYSPPNILGRGA